MHTISHEWLPSEVPFAPYYLVRRTLHPRSLPTIPRTTSACPYHAAACRAVQCPFGFSNASHGLQVHVRAMLLHAGQSNVPSGSPMPGSLTEHMLTISHAIFQAFARWR